MFILNFGDSFLDSVRKLDKIFQLQIKKKLEKLEDGKARIEPLRGKLVGKHKIRVGKYRVILKILNDKEIRLLEVGPRDKIYK